MAKLTKTYENRIEKIELEFMGEKYDYSMIEDDDGRTGDKPFFDVQLKNKHPEFEGEDDLMEALDRILFESYEDDIFEILEQLEEWEYDDRE
jgi:hypothetical protein